MNEAMSKILAILSRNSKDPKFKQKLDKAISRDKNLKRIFHNADVAIEKAKKDFEERAKNDPFLGDLAKSFDDMLDV